MLFEICRDYKGNLISATWQEGENPNYDVVARFLANHMAKKLEEERGCTDAGSIRHERMEA
jgi:hypothetical protein